MQEKDVADVGDVVSEHGPIKYVKEPFSPIPVSWGLQS